MSLVPQFRVPPHHTFTGLQDPDRGDAHHYGEGSQMHQSSVPHGTCFGLPYQDHNYGAPPPPTPPPSPPPPTRLNGLNGHLEGVDVDIENVSLNTTVITSGTAQVQEADSPERVQQDNEDSIDDSITRCICDYVHDDGYMICCDRCSVWQHVDCMGVDRANIPEIYYCERCEPRKLNKQRAVQLQTRKREVLMIDTSATESENETKQFAEKPKNRKKKIEKKELSLAKFANGNRKQKKLDKDGKRKQGSRKALHQSNLKKSPVKVNRLKSVRSPVAVKEDGTSLPWQSKQYADTYEEAPGNVYSPGVQDLLFQTKVNGVNNHEARPPLHLQAQVCRVSQFGDNQKGLEALEHLALGQAVIEYKGNVMLRDQYNQEKFFFQRYEPHVLFYPDIANLDLCIDASTYGNDARHVRRSCCPNAEVRHFLDGNQVYFYIFTTKSIPKGYEITIPFDFSHQQCNYYVECACSKPNCAVAKFHKGITTNTEEIPLQVLTKAAKKQKKIPKALDEPLHIDIGKVEVKPAPMTSPPTKRRRLSSHNAAKDKGTPVKEDPRHSNLASPKTPGLASPQFSGPSDHEGEEGDRPTKKLSREERKLAAIMKAFEKLEKQQERKKESQHKVEHDKPREQEVEVKVKQQKVRGKGTKSEVKGEDIPPTSPPPPVVKAKEKKEKSQKETRKASTEKRRASKPEPIKEVEASSHLKEEEVEVKVKDEPPVIEEEKPIKVEVLPECDLSSPVKKQEELMSASHIENVEKNCVLTAVKEETAESDTERGTASLTTVPDTSLTLREERPRMAKGKKKRGGSTPARRKSRVSSSVSTTTTDSADDEASVPQTPNTAGSSSVSSDNATPQTPSVDKGFKFPKTKKHLMSEWLSEKSTDCSSPTRSAVRVEPLEISVAGSSEAEADFVKCVPSPHTNSLSHLRRSSVSNVSSHTRAVDSIPGVQLDTTNLGSAKKRWLRQAMFERSTSVPASKDHSSTSTLSPVPHSCTTSPAASPPVDFVTPLKKRRFARESMSKESPYGQMPSTPTHPSAGTPPEDQESFSPNSSLDHPINMQEDSQRLDATTTASLDAVKNGIYVDRLINLVKKENIFERISLPIKGMPCDSVASFEHEHNGSHFTERKLLFDKTLSAENTSGSEPQEQSDLNIGCSQGFEVSDSESAPDCCVKTAPRLWDLQTISNNETEAASTSTECDYSSNNNKQLDTNVTGQIGSSESEVQLESCIGEKNCEKLIHRSGKTDITSPKHCLNLSGDSGLISDQEKTCSSSSLSESILQDSMCNSFDSTESIRGHVDVDSSQGITIKQTSSQDVTTSVNNGTSEALHKSCNSGSHLVCLDSLRDHKCLESTEDNVVDSLTESHCVNSLNVHSSHHSKSTSSQGGDNSVVSSAVDSIGDCTLGSGNVTGETPGEDNTVSCSAQSSGEALMDNTEGEEERLGDREFPAHSTNVEKPESEKEEGEITDDDEEEEMVDSSSVVVQPSPVTEKEVESSTNEADNIVVHMEENTATSTVTTTTSSLSSSSSDNSKDLSLQQTSKSENNNQGEVSSSRSTSPYWDNGLYSKRGLWRHDKDAAPSNNRTPPSNHSSPSATESPHSHQQYRNNLISNKSESDVHVDSTSEQKKINPLSPIVSSSEVKLRQQEVYGAMEVCESLSPGALADSITSPLGFGQTSAPLAGKKKVSLLEYRKRMKQRSSHDGPSVLGGSSGSVSRSNSTTSNGSSSTTQSAPNTPLYPAMPIFPNIPNNIQKNKDKKQQQLLSPAEASPKDYSSKKKKEEDLKWSATATMAERVREQTHITLTERLRKEFGLDTVDDTDEKEESDDEPPPPPPPVPPTTSQPVLLPTHITPPPPLPPIPVVPSQSVSHHLGSAQAQSLIQQTMLAVANSAQQSAQSLGVVGQQQAQMLAQTSSIQMMTSVASQPISSTTNPPPALIIGQNAVLLPTPASSAPVTTAQSNSASSVPSSSNFIHEQPTTTTSHQHLVAAAIGANTVLNNKQQPATQPFVTPTQTVFLPLQTQPPQHQFNHQSSNVSHPQLAAIPQPPVPQLPPVTTKSINQELNAAKAPSLLPTPVAAVPAQPAGTTLQGLLPNPPSQRFQQNSADSTAIPCLLAIPTMPTKIFNRLTEDVSFVALEQGASLEDMDYSSSRPAAEATIPETTSHNQHPFPAVTQAQLLVNYNHGFPQTGINLHK